MTTILDISSRRTHTEPELLQLLAADNPPAMRVRLGEFSSMAIGLPQRQLQFVLMDLDVETGDAIDVSVRVLRSLMSAGLVTSAWIERGSGDSEVLPQLPLADTRTHAIAATDAEVAEHYDDVEAFWSCWDALERIGEYRLATRAIDAVHPADFLDAVQDGHRAMARLAKPGAARYYRVSLRSEDEREVYCHVGDGLCVAHEHCRGGELCDFGTFTCAAVPRCEADRDCAGGERCAEGICVPIER